MGGAGAESGRFDHLIPDLSFVRLRYRLRSEEHAELPQFKGSTIRGALGHQVRRMVCVMDLRQPCATCPHLSYCHYGRTFETEFLTPPPDFARGVQQAPKGYVVECDDEREVLLPGAILEFCVTLFGVSTDLKGLIDAAVMRLARVGLGARRWQFAVHGARPPSGQDTTGTNEPGAALEVERSSTSALASPALADRARLQFHISTERGGLNQQALRPRGLVGAAIRRLLLLAHAHSPRSATQWQFREILDHASTISVEESDIEVVPLHRWSNRQRAHTPLDALRGHLLWKGDLAPLTKVLRAAEVFHVGKHTTDGLGRLAVTSLAPLSRTTNDPLESLE